MPTWKTTRPHIKENEMSITTGRSEASFPGYPIGSEASVHDLLNDATEWLQYARGLTGLLADLIHEADSVDCQAMALGLEAIKALTQVGVRCTAEAHARLCWSEANTGRCPVDAS
ncbi:hypothetical protein ACVWWJ_003492 [Luteibacter sp. HA06]|jgi:hypothetical protein